MPRKWMQELPAYSPKGVAHEVDGQTLTFYPVCPDVFFKLRSVAPALAMVVTKLLTPPKDTDQSYVSRSYTTPEGESGVQNESEAISVELAKLREAQTRGVVNDVIEAITSDDTRAAVGCIILDSLRDRNDAAPIELQEGREFMQNRGTPSIFAYLKGVKAANSEVLGPLVEAVSAMTKSMPTRIAEAVSGEASAQLGTSRSPRSTEGSDEEAPEASSESSKNPST